MCKCGILWPHTFYMQRIQTLFHLNFRYALILFAILRCTTLTMLTGRLHNVLNAVLWSKTRGNMKISAPKMFPLNGLCRNGVCPAKSIKHGEYQLKSQSTRTRTWLSSFKLQVSWKNRVYFFRYFHEDHPPMDFTKRYGVKTYSIFQIYGLETIGKSF